MTTQTHARTDAVPGGRVVRLPRCHLVVVSGPQRGLERLVDADRFRIGKSRENDLVLDDPTVSRVHCEILRDPKGFLLRDLGSTNGTLLDGTAVREGYLEPGCVLTVGHVEVKVRPAQERRVEVLPSESDRFGQVVGGSLAMRELFGLLERLAPTDATVLIGGETGTGKDALARAIHDHSPRRERPFIVVDCGAVVGSLIESELFGHEKGAFTGATAARQGAFELADGGTLFLDEIGELPLDLQPKLLRALEQRSFRRVGGTRELAVDIRVVAATKRNLRMEVERGKFREDLFFRLAVVDVELPPLRERREDVAPIARALLERLSEREPGTAPLSVAPAVVEALAAHDWPGNVRELRNVLERSAYMARAAGRNRIEPGDAPFAGTPATAPEHPGFVPGRSYRDTRTAWEEEFERRYVRWLLDRHGGNVSAAAREADMDRKYLHRLAKKHGLK
ncbi:MAG: sigma 54-interacting transcriptional regulator [Myxococcota bacterium]